jgi:hypothetical protein
MDGQIEIPTLRTTQKVKNAFKKARDLNLDVKKFETSPRNLKITLKNLKGNYLYQRYNVDSSCTLNCKFLPFEEKEVQIEESYQQTLILNPYSVTLLIFQLKPKEPETPVATGVAQPAAAAAPQQQTATEPAAKAKD